MSSTAFSQSDEPLLDASQQYLSFMLEQEEYGVDILRVQEVRGWTPVTRIPDMPRYLKGVLNLRGTIIPVIDLRERFSMAIKEYGPTTVVVVVKVGLEGRERVMGMVVDAVAETYSLPSGSIQPPPTLSGAVNPEFITGLASHQEKMIVILDVDELLSSDALAIVTNNNDE